MKRRALEAVMPLVLAAATLLFAAFEADAAPLRIVAIGASNTHGWYIGKEAAYPAQLQDLLKAKGIDAQVTNAGVPFDTTAAMLRRIDTDVPKGTDIAILQPGANDRRFFGTAEQRAEGKEIQPHDPAHWGLGRAGRTPIAGGNRPAGGAGVGRSRVRRREGDGTREGWRRLAQLPRDEPARRARRPGYQAMR